MPNPTDSPGGAASGRPMPQPAAHVRVTAWGELPGERNLPAALQVLVAGQAAGGIEARGGEWIACWYTAAHRDRTSVHPSAAQAVRAVARSGWARKLGARAASTVTWSQRASNRVRRLGGGR